MREYCKQHAEVIHEKVEREAKAQILQVELYKCFMEHKPFWFPKVFWKQLFASLSVKMLWKVEGTSPEKEFEKSMQSNPNQS